MFLCFWYIIVYKSFHWFHNSMGEGKPALIIRHIPFSEILRCIWESRQFSEFWVKLLLPEDVSCFWWRWGCPLVHVCVHTAEDKCLGIWCTTLDVLWWGEHVVVGAEKREELPRAHSGSFSDISRGRVPWPLHCWHLEPANSVQGDV